MKKRIIFKHGSKTEQRNKGLFFNLNVKINIKSASSRLVNYRRVLKICGKKSYPFVINVRTRTVNCYFCVGSGV